MMLLNVLLLLLERSDILLLGSLLGPSEAGLYAPASRIATLMALGLTAVALTGRVYVRCNAENGPIEPGDLLTTSSTGGVAMRATDPARAFGAVFGKALSRFSAEDGEEGLVLVLVSLQ